MKCFVVVATLLQVAFTGHVAVRLPYLNPAGVTYVSGPTAHGAPLTVAPGPQYEYAAAPQGHYAQGPAVRYAAEPAHQYAAHGPALQYVSQGPALQYAAHGPALQYAAVPAKVEAHHVGYAAAQVPAVAAVPFVKHVPAVAQVPVTRYEAQHGVIEKQVDVAKPAVSTRKFQVRRPAIQKQFYDIEERVIVRPAGSALVELDEPTSKVQKGPTVVQPLAHAAPISVTPVPDHSVISHAPVHHITASPVHVTPSPILVSSPSPSPVLVSSTPAPHFDDEAVVVDNADFRSAASLRQKERQIEDLQHQQAVLQAEIRAEHAAQERFNYAEPSVITHSNGSPVEAAARFVAHDSAPAIVPSLKASPEQSKSNQHKLIELLTARGGVAEVGFGREGPASHVGDAGHVRARVLSATPAPEYADATGERVSTRRVVVSRPIETLQEFDVVEPATKIERVSYQQPTLIKTAHLDHVQVPTSVPVYGKALAPAVAHAAVPVYQKTISPAVQYYQH